MSLDLIFALTSLVGFGFAAVFWGSDSPLNITVKIGQAAGLCFAAVMVARAIQ